MKKKLLSLGVFSLLFLASFAQFTVTTVPPLAGTNGNAGIVFGVTSTQTILIDTIYCSFTGIGTTDIWVTTTDLTGPPTITTANGWTNLGAATIATATTFGNVVAIPLNLGYTVLPNTNYRFAVNGAGAAGGAALTYTTGSAGVSAPFSDGTVTIETGNLVGYGGTFPNPNFHPRQFNGSIGYTILGGMNDAAVLSVDSPTVYCAGTQDVYATIANFGSNQIDSVDVDWSVNGVAQTQLKYVGLLDTLNGAGSQSAQVLLGNFNFPAGASNIEVLVSNPNGMVDTTNFNDTLNVAVQSAAAPTAISFTNITLTTVDVNAVGGAGTVDYEIGPAGFALGTGTMGSSPTPNFTISGLSQGTTYDVYVRSNCGSGDVSAYVGPQTFNTSYAIPFDQDFENFPNGAWQNGFPEGWTASQGPGFPVPRWESELGDGTSPGFGTGAIWDNTNYGSPGIFMFMETSGGVQSSVDFVSPPIFVDTNLSTVELGYHYFMFGPAVDTLQVIADTNGVETVLATYVGQQQAAQADPWLFASHFLTGYQGKSVTIKFRGTNQAGFAGGDIAIDDVTLDPVLPLNTGVLEVQNPTGNLCAGPTNVIVGVKNFGSNVVDSVNVLWNINGVLDSVMYVGTILPGDTASVSLATINVSSTVVYDLAFYTNRPNNGTDQFFADDTLKIQGLRTGLDGVYTLDGSLAASNTNFTTFGQLEQVLNTYGVCGSVTVNVAAGTYNETLALENILGVSATNRITIDGGDSATTVLENNLANDNAVIALNGVSYTTIKNLTVRSTRTNTTLHSGVHLSNNSNFDSLVGVRVTVNPTATFNVFGVMATLNPSTNFGNGVHANNFVMMNSSVDGGDWNICFRGNGGNFPGPASSNGWNMNNHFINNTLTGADDYGIYTDDQDGLQAIGNTISGLRTTSTFTGYGITAFDGMNFKISANNIVVPYTGIYVTNANSSNTGTRIGFSEVSNNMVSCNVNSGIWLQRPYLVNIWNNSVYCGSTQNFDAALYLDDGFGTPAIDSLDVRNNAVYGAGKAFKIDEPDSVFTKFDNNAFYTIGTDLLDIDGALYADLATYQTAQPAYNAASLDGDPQFVSLTDLHVVGAFLDGGGDISVPITVDIDGETRPLPGSTTVDIGADEFDPPLCPPSTNLGATNITLTSADIFWDGTAMDYQYEVVVSGAGQGAGTVVRTPLDSVTITGLTASTSYDFYVREICGRGDTSIWIGPFTFGTSNGVPYLEDFDSFTAGLTGTTFPKGWTSTTTTNPRWESEVGTGVNVNSGNTGPFYDNTSFGTNGGVYMYLETSGGAGNTADLRSPGIFVDPTQASLTLEVAIHMFGATMGTLEVLVDSNGVENSLFTITGAQQTAQADPYILRTANIGGYQGKSISIIFRGTSGTSFTSDIAIDDVRIFEPSPTDGAVTDILSPTSGCGLGAADSVTVEISNLGTAAFSNFPVVYTLNGGTPVVETFTGSIAPGAVTNFTFNTTVNLATPGSYDIVAYTNLTADGDVTNDTTDVTINSIPIVGGFPYNEGFENGNGGWTVQGVSTFALGTPAGTVINSAANGTQSWVTNLTGNYNNSEAGWVASPCLDFSTLVNPVIEMSVWWNAEFSWDGAVLQSSVDGGVTWQNVGAFGDPDNWYTDNTINGLANINNQEGWTGRASSSNGSGGWVTAKNSLSSLAGVPGVILRVAFGSDASVQDEGFAFDDVVIRESAAYDMAVINIETPISGAYLAGTNDSVRVTIANLGSDTATNFTMNYSLNGGAVQTETIAQMLPNDTMLFTFNSAVPLPGPGQADTLDVFVDFSLDSVYTNDSIIGYIYDNDIKALPYTEDFENGYVTGFVSTNSQGGWTSTRGAAPRWELEDATGANENSTATGPFYDRTTFGTAGGFYAYLECSGGVLGDQDTLRSPSIVIPANAQPLSLDYSYHMFGANMGTLEVFIEANGTYTRIDSIGGQIQLAGDSAWSDTSIALTGAFNGQIVNIVFIGSRGNGFTSDMSIDDISLDFFVGVDQVASELEGISVSPNPSNGLFTLNIETPSQENFNMTVRDAQGRSVYTANFDVNGIYRDDIDLKSLAKGIYYLHLQTETGSRVEKLIIQ